ncbi:MAG: AIR synthase related protein, partial [Desulfobacterales bacterium]|nr:AIR synthase related protein [Desulfobacterales bacterium]
MEKELINSISSLLPRSYQQLNKVFESDSEIVPFGDMQMLFTVDEYSSEDQFRDGDAFNLGWNYTVATLSDIYASGGKPMYYAHSMVLDEVKRDTKYTTSFTKGIAEVLGNTGCCFIGGDIGTGINWHYTGIAIGKSKEPITRIGCKSGDLILMTGNIGTGNLEAALNIYSSNQLLKQITNTYKTWLVPRSLESK